MAEVEEATACSPFDLSVEAVGGELGVGIDGRRLVTPGGREVVHKRRAVLDAALDDLQRRGALIECWPRLVYPEALTVMELLCTTIEREQPDVVTPDIASDPFLSAVKASEAPADAPIQRVVAAARVRVDEGEIDEEALGRLWRDRSSVERQAVLILHRRHSAGLVLPMCLCAGLVDERDYARATLFTKASGADDSLEQTTRQFTRCCQDAWTTKVFLAASTDNVEQIVNEGESGRLEFKATFRLNLRSDRLDEVISHASLKTIAGFMNAQGGRLIIGVCDDKTPFKNFIGADQLGDVDRFLRHLLDRVRAAMGESVATAVEVRMLEYLGEPVCVIDCPASEEPVILETKQQGQEYFVRVGAATHRLECRDAIAHARQRF